MIFAQCRKAFPQLTFEIKIVKTTGDRLQSQGIQTGQTLPKGLFTKELEVALVRNRADLAVHSLKDLPTELPAGLTLGAVTQREDPREVLIYRHFSDRKGFEPGLDIFRHAFGLPGRALLDRAFGAPFANLPIASDVDFDGVEMVFP